MPYRIIYEEYRKGFKPYQVQKQSDYLKVWGYVKSFETIEEARQGVEDDKNKKYDHVVVETID